jgi:tetratricopeptide (TPR) repeat protein
MALQTEQVRTTPQALEYTPRGTDRSRALSWARLRAVTAHVEPAWAGAEVVVTLAFAPPAGPKDSVPLARGRRLEVFGDLAAARALIETARQRAPQALIGPVAQLLLTMPQPDSANERWHRGKLRDYAFAAAAALALGRQHLGQGRLMAAARDFERAVRRDPRDTEAWRWLGLTHLLAGRAQRAEAAVNHMLALGARDREAYVVDALSVYAQRRFRQAEEELRQVLRGQAADAAMRGVLACSLVQQWRIDEARLELEALGANYGEGWGLMAQKCVMCAEGYRAHQARLSREPWLRWQERWKTAATRLAGIVSGLLLLLRYLSTRRAWIWVLGVAAAVVVLHALSAERGDRRWQEQLVDAQGQVPNMPCWYVSLVWGGHRPLSSKRSIIEEIERRWGEE